MENGITKIKYYFKNKYNPKSPFPVKVFTIQEVEAGKVKEYCEENDLKATDRMKFIDRQDREGNDLFEGDIVRARSEVQYGESRDRPVYSKGSGKRISTRTETPTKYKDIDYEITIDKNFKRIDYTPIPSLPQGERFARMLEQPLLVGEIANGLKLPPSQEGEAE